MTQATNDSGTSAAPAASGDPAADAAGKPNTTTTSQGSTDEGAVKKPESALTDGLTDDGAKDAPVQPKAPEKYEPFKLAEGQELDTEAFALAEPVFRKLNLTQENAQSLVDTFGGIMQSLEKRIETERAETVAGWLKTAKADTEIGGAKWAKSIKDAQGIIGRYADNEFKVFLEQTGLTNHPGLIKMLARAGARMSEGTFENAGGGSGMKAEKSLEEIFYGKSATG